MINDPRRPPASNTLSPHMPITNYNYPRQLTGSQSVSFLLSSSSSPTSSIGGIREYLKNKNIRHNKKRDIQIARGAVRVPGINSPVLGLTYACGGGGHFCGCSIPYLRRF